MQGSLESLTFVLTFVLQVVLDHPKNDSILYMGPFLAFGPWDEPYLEIEGKPVTLNDIEQSFLL